MSDNINTKAPAGALGTKDAPAPEKKNVGTAEFIGYLVAVFFYSNMTGMVGSYRKSYLVNVLQISPDQNSLLNTLGSVIPFVLNFFVAMYIDRRSTGKNGKFKPLLMWTAVPMGVLLFLHFWTPAAFTGTILMIYLVAVAVLWGVLGSFGNSVNMISNVMTPNLKERDKVISFRSISSAVGNSAPLVIVLVIGLIFKDEGTQYIIGGALCAVCGILTMLFGIRGVKERVVLHQKRENPLLGIGHVLKNKYAWIVIISEFLKNFRQLASYMGVFLAAALLGSTSKFLLFGLPTGIGTAVGMLVINALLKKFNSRVLYIASGIYSLLINTAAFGVGYAYFNSGNSFLQILFIVLLFLIGLQFGASNLLPTMFQADVLESIEVQSGSRLDATLPFVVGVGTMISGTVAQAFAPQVLYRENFIINYVQPSAADPNPVQSLRTKILLLFFYTIFHGIMMFLAGVPYFFYGLHGKTKDDIHEQVLALREERAKAAEA